MDVVQQQHYTREDAASRWSYQERILGLISTVESEAAPTSYEAAGKERRYSERTSPPPTTATAKMFS